MPTDTERRLEHLENLLLFGGGVVAGTASGRQLAAAAARRAPGVAARVARRHPVGTAAAIAYIAYKQGLSVETAQELIEDSIGEVVEAQRFVSPLLAPVQIGTAVRDRKRKISKANKAVKRAVDLLRAGTKGATGADKGKLPKNYWKMATTAAGLANPKTPSKITKGTTKVKRLARTLRSWWK